MRSEHWLITATPPTPNGDLHLGHLSGPYLAADILGRHLRRRSATAVTMTGIDDNQSYTEAYGIRHGTTAADTARWFGGRIVRAWMETGLDFDVIGRPDRMPYHVELTRRVFRTLVDRGDIVSRVRPLPFCARCDRWAFEAYVVGTCPHCGIRACGNACEVCGRPNDCADLGDPQCTICGAACELRECERLYLPLDRHAETLRRFWASVRMNGHLSALCADMAEEGLPEIAVSHPASWGIEVPVEGFADQRIYVWFEMAAGYLAAGQGRTGKGVWRAGRRVVQCFGFDNGYFHAVLFPVIMRAYDPVISLPTDFISNEFYRLDGAKFSTSRQHAVWLLEALKEVAADHLRLYLAWDRPVASQTSFTWEGMRSFLYGDLVPRWRSWLSALSRRCDIPMSPHASSVESRASIGPSEHRANQTVRRLQEFTAETLQFVDAAYSVEHFSPRTAIQRLDLLVRTAAETGDDLEQLGGRASFRNAFVRGVRAELGAASALAAGLYPLAPDMAGQLWGALGHSGAIEETRWDALDQEFHASGPDFDALGQDFSGEKKVHDLVGACPLFAAG